MTRASLLSCSCLDTVQGLGGCSRSDRHRRLALQVTFSHPDEVFQRIFTAIREARPFSFVRLGDGEGRVMGYPDHVSVLHMSDIWKTWFGHSFYADSQIRFLQQELKTATLAADVIGLPQAVPDPDTEWGRTHAVGVRDGYFTPGTMFCNAGIHLHFEAENLYEALLKDSFSVSVVGPRNVGDRLKQLYGISDVPWVQTPPEMRYSMMNEDEKVREIVLRPHFVDKYQQIMTYGLPGVTAPGRVVLVGAGVLGKIYCRRVKELGGVAIDVGSMMDLWGGLNTRGLGVFKGLTEPTM